MADAQVMAGLIDISRETYSNNNDDKTAGLVRRGAHIKIKSGDSVLIGLCAIYRAFFML